MYKNKHISQDVNLDIMERTAQKIVTIVKTRLLVGYRMENAIVLDVLEPVYQLPLCKGKTLHNYLDTVHVFKPHCDIDIQ